METQITLVQAIFGMGNPNHDHVHRYNTVNIGNEDLDNIKLEQMQGGVTVNTISRVGMNSGNLSVMPEGYVNIEEGFNLRRGLAMLKFHIETGALVQLELTGMFYLYGGGFSTDGIDSDVKLVPVRFWEIERRATSSPTTFLPVVESRVTSTNQVLLSDIVGARTDLRSLRPVDIGEFSTGKLATEEDWGGETFAGTVNGKLSNAPVLSKTDNMDPSFFARQTLRMATNVSDLGTGDLVNSLASSLTNPSLRESQISDNAFFRAMQSSLSNWSLSGFSGYTVGEIDGVFVNFPDVLNLNMLDENKFAVTDNRFETSEYGTASSLEVLATEVAMITVNLLIQCGLTVLEFAASNNSADMAATFGGDSAVTFIPGQAMSVHDEDDGIINRVEQFQSRFINTFFGKYTDTNAANTTIISISVFSSVFGETIIEIFVNGDQTTTRRYSNATYAIGRTSNNIASGDAALGTSESFIKNLKEYFS